LRALDATVCFMECTGLPVNWPVWEGGGASILGLVGVAETARSSP
jgi:hypothetical protein